MNTLIHLFKAYYGKQPTVVEPMAGAGSNRKYYRLEAEGEKAVGVCGTSVEENLAFIYLSRHFTERGMPMPKIYEVSDDSTHYLQKDLGKCSLYDKLAPARARGYKYGVEESVLLERTIRGLAHLQTDGALGIEEDKLLSPRKMDVRAAMFDLNYFKYMFLRAQDVPIDEILLEDDMMKLSSDLCGEPCHTFLYRDFQARNVMLVEDQPNFIDYQGGRIGPLQYDVASFLWQASARYPEELKQKLIEAYLDELRSILPVNTDEFQEKLQGFVLLRTLQVLGAYGLRGIIERKAYFLQSIPAAISNLHGLLLQGTCRAYPYLEQTLQRLCEAEINYGKDQ